jgi:hypothetical protein
MGRKKCSEELVQKEMCTASPHECETSNDVEEVSSFTSVYYSVKCRLNCILTLGSNNFEVDKRFLLA